MTETLPAALLSSLSDFLSQQMGLHFAPSRLADLERGLCAAAAEFDFKELEACVEWLLSSPPLSKSQIETLASQLTVGETYFFRERQVFEALELQVLPELIRSRACERRLRIWSAGCATGEEPYSLAILLARMVSDAPNWNISILGTDINPRSLQRAAAGVYTEWSFRDCPAGTAEAHFRKAGEREWEIAPAIRKLVDFSYLNLVEDLYPLLLNETNALDLIFCRNVLMYFSAEQARRVIARLHRCLADGGWLVVSSTEASHILFSQFTTVHFPGAILYRKDPQPAPAFVFTVPVGWDEPPAGPAARLEIAAAPSPRNFQPPLEIAVPELADPQGESPAPPAPDPFAEYAEGRYSEAQQSAAELLRQQPDNAPLMALQARILANQGHLAEALAWCDKAIAVEKLDAGFYYLRATILQEQSAMSEAVDALKRSLFLDHNFVLAHFALGSLHRSLGRPREAEKQFVNVVRLLNAYRPDEILPQSEGITAGRLRDIVDFRLTIVD